jgi:hypothetical protein
VPARNGSTRPDGEEHQQKQPKLVEYGQADGDRTRRGRQPVFRVRPQQTQHGGPEHEAADDLTDHARLTELYECPADQVRHQYHESEHGQQVRQRASRKNHPYSRQRIIVGEAA